MTNNFSSSMPPDQPSVPSMSSTPLVASSCTSPYLPAGVPPWPTTVLQRPSLATATSADTMAGKISDRKSRTARSIFITLGLIALTLLVGVGLTYGVLYFNGQVGANTASTSRLVKIPNATAQPTNGTNTSTPSASTSTLPTPTSFSAMSTNHQKSLGVLVKYPSDWVEDPPTQPAQDGTAVAYFHPQQQQLNIAIYLGKFSVASSHVTTTTALNQALIGTIYGNGSNSGNTNLQAVQSTRPQRTIAGMQWDEQDATFSDTNSSLIHVTSITIKHGSFFYGFIVETPDAYYSDMSQKYVPPMLDSFKFLS